MTISDKEPSFELFKIIVDYSELRGLAHMFCFAVQFWYWVKAVSVFT